MQNCDNGGTCVNVISTGGTIECQIAGKTCPKRGGDIRVDIAQKNVMGNKEKNVVRCHYTVKLPKSAPFGVNDLFFFQACKKEGDKLTVQKMKDFAKAQRQESFFFDYNNYDNSYKYNVNNDPWISGPIYGNQAEQVTELALLGGILMLLMIACVCCSFVIGFISGKWFNTNGNDAKIKKANLCPSQV
eukprot:207360_1